MLKIIGEVVDVETRERRVPATGEVFEQTSVWVQSGRTTEECTLGRDWPADQVPRRGEMIEAIIAMRPFARKGGAPAVGITLLSPSELAAGTALRGV